MRRKCGVPEVSSTIRRPTCTPKNATFLIVQMTRLRSFIHFIPNRLIDNSLQHGLNRLQPHGEVRSALATIHKKLMEISWRS
jgi:hypothetical protein